MIEILLTVVLLGCVVALVLCGRSSAKNDVLAEGLENASKRKKAVDTVDSMPTSTKREQLRKYTRK